VTDSDRARRTPGSSKEDTGEAPETGPVTPPPRTAPSIGSSFRREVPAPSAVITPRAGGLVPRGTRAARPLTEPAASTDALFTPVIAPIVKVKPSDPPRIAQGDMLGPSSPANLRGAGSRLCELLLRFGAVTDEMVDRALAIQEERGGQIGRILVSLGACDEDDIAHALLEQLRIRRREGNAGDASTAARERKDVVGLNVLTRPKRTVAVLLATDLSALLVAALLATAVHWLRTYGELGILDASAWLVVAPSIALCVLAFFGLELYSPMAKSTPEELRDTTFVVSLVHLGASLLSTLGNLPIVKWGIFVRSVWWLATLLLVPIARALVRDAFCKKPWWGIPVCVLGAAKTGRLVVRTLNAQPRSGLKPVMLLDDDVTKHGTLRASITNEELNLHSMNIVGSPLVDECARAELTRDIFGTDEDLAELEPISSDHIPAAPGLWRPSVSIRMPDGTIEAPASNASGEPGHTLPRGKFAEVEGVPLVGDLSLAPLLASRLSITCAVLAMPGVESAKLLQIVEHIGGKFTHLLIIPDLFGFATMGVPAKSLGGILGVEVRQQLLLPGPRLAKRIMDLALTLVGGVFVLPFLLLIAALIKLDSRGPALYKQKRLGIDGTYFTAFKFRTMHGDGEERLKAVLDSDPALAAEYEVFHKLRIDPRVTRFGRLLRKYSLDEFPQLLNVLRGEMSLVGPRPYIERELTEMRGQEGIVLRAPPGMTGMWQVSDRNATSFAQRVQIDVYYVRNWSPWLDIHILAKTFGVVLKGSGV
jgi:lipopolysaccharide/colanic/teichoic acid biosynthesis glycosyltransferase